jgi:hypothetical protein
MKMQNKWTRALVVVVALAVIAGVGIVAVPGVAQAATSYIAPFEFGLRGSGGNELLADALGITVDELNTAQLEARNAAIDQAVEEGTLTQEEADLMKTREAFHAFVSERVQAAYDQAVADAVAQGIVTQEQADEFTQPGGMMFMRDGMGRGFMRHGLGGPDDMLPGGRMLRPGDRSQ